MYLCNLTISSPPSNLDWIPALLHSQNSWSLLKIIVTYICTNKYTNATWWVHNLWLIRRNKLRRLWCSTAPLWPNVDVFTQQFPELPNGFRANPVLKSLPLAPVFLPTEEVLSMLRAATAHFFSCSELCLGDLKSCLECWTHLGRTMLLKCGIHATPEGRTFYRKY